MTERKAGSPLPCWYMDTAYLYCPYDGICAGLGRIAAANFRRVAGGVALIRSAAVLTLM